VSDITQLQIAQHENREKRRCQIGGKGQTAAKYHESEEITLPETPQEHDKGKIIGRIFPVRRLVHAADKIPGTISRCGGEGKYHPESSAVVSLVKHIQQQPRRDDARDSDGSHGPVAPAEVL